MGPGYKSTSHCNELYGAVLGGVRIHLRAYGTELEGRPTLEPLQCIFATDLMIRNKK